MSVRHSFESTLEMAKSPAQKLDELVANSKLQPSVLKHHPDAQELRDWGMYGPRDAEIEQLVWALAYKHDLRLAEIEELIKTTLREKLVSLDRWAEKEGTE